MLVPFSKLSCLLQGMDRYFDEMCGNSQPQMSVCWVFNYKKMLKKHDAWHGAMVWPHHALVKIWEGPCFRKGNPQDWRGIQIFLFFALEFFLRRTYTLQITVFKFGIFPGSFTIFRGLCAFSRHLAHINPIQLQLHGCDVRDVDCRSIVAHSMVHTHDPHGWGSGQS